MLRLNERVEIDEESVILRSGALKRKNNTLVIQPKEDSEKPIFVPIKNISSIMVFSEVYLSRRVFELFTREKVPVFFYNRSDEYIGTYYPVETNLLIEGNIRKSHYLALGNILSRKDFTFEERLIKPPKDEINAMIILYKVALSEIYKPSLGPFISFLHEPNKRKFSLQLDIAELYKFSIVDRSVLTLVNKSI